MILAATVGVACLSAVVGALITNHAHNQSLTPRHSACAAAVGFCIFIVFAISRINYLIGLAITVVMVAPFVILFGLILGLWHSIAYVIVKLFY